MLSEAKIMGTETSSATARGHNINSYGSMGMGGQDDAAIHHHEHDSAAESVPPPPFETPLRRRTDVVVESPE